MGFTVENTPTAPGACQNLSLIGSQAIKKAVIVLLIRRHWFSHREESGIVC